MPQACADLFKPSLIEASGSDAFIVMPSASRDVAAKAATSAAFLSCGQVCTSAERLHVHEDVCDRFSFFVSPTIMTGVAPDWMW